MGRMRETKVTDTELNWLYPALIDKQPIDPSYLIINRWCCEATSGSRDIGSGCYLSMLAISLGPGITRNHGYLLPGTPLVFEYLKQGKYISGDERGGFHVAKVNLLLLDPRLRLFIQGKEDWLEEGLLVPAKKNKRGRIVEEGSTFVQAGGAQLNYVPPFRGIPTPPNYCGGPTMQAWGSGPAMPPTPDFLKKTKCIPICMPGSSFMQRLQTSQAVDWGLRTPSTSNIFTRLQSSFLLLRNIVYSKGEHLSYSASVGKRMNAKAL
jgi:hypothetical protein